MSNPFEAHSPKAEGTSLQVLIAKAQEFRELELAKAELELEVKQLSGRINKIKAEELPDLMSELGLDEFKLSDGKKLKLKNFVSGSLPKEAGARKEALDWLKANEHGDVIKTFVELTFGKSEGNFAAVVIDDLRGKGLEPSVDEGVHPQTLQSLARDLMKDGKEIPLETLGLFAGKVVEAK